MKIALISDIHSNLYYFEEVLKVIEKEDVADIYCLGDLVGYYDKPNEVIDLIRLKNIKTIKGNHEQYLLGNLKYNRDNDDIYRIESQKELLTEENIKFLRNLPEEIKFSIGDKKFYITHSLPGDCLKYAYSLNDLDREFVSKYDYYCFSHTHIPMISYYYGTCVINTGSIGQPRDYTKRPSFILIDLVEDRVTLVKVTIDEHKYCKTLLNKNLNKKLINILQRVTEKNKN